MQLAYTWLKNEQLSPGKLDVREMQNLFSHYYDHGNISGRYDSDYKKAEEMHIRPILYLNTLCY